MKYLDSYFFKIKLIYVWLINILISSIIWLAFWLILLVGTIPIHKEISLCLTMGFVLGTVITGIVFLMRGVNTFFRKAELVEELVNNAKTKEEIVEIQNDEFKKLRDLSFHQQTGARLREIYSVMKARYELLPNKN